MINVLKVTVSITVTILIKLFVITSVYKVVTQFRKNLLVWWLYLHGGDKVL